MHTMRRHGTEHSRGQVLVITALALVVLIGIAALVLDLGFSWMLRRHEQNAADPASIAAARWLVDATTGDPVSPATVQDQMNAEACFYAQENGFFDGDPGCVAALGSPAGIDQSADLQVHSPPISGDYAGQSGRVQVIIRATHPTFFARIWGQSEASVSTSAVATNDAGTGNSASLVALKMDPSCSAGSAGTVTGGGNVLIEPADGVDEPGGYVYINAPCGTSDDESCVGSGPKGLDINGGATLTAPFAYLVGSCVENGGGDFVCLDASPCLDEQHQPPLSDPLAGLPEPQLANFPTPNCPNPAEPNNATSTGCSLDAKSCPDVGGVNTCSLVPGVYYGGWFVKSNVAVQLQPGLYYLAGGGIRVQSGSSIESVESASGIPPRVTIFSTEGPGCPSIAQQCQSAITFSATAGFEAKATSRDKIDEVTGATILGSCTLILNEGGPNTCPWAGILLWQDGTVAHPGAGGPTSVTIGGQSSLILSGTIYAPTSNVSINSGTGTTGCAGDESTQACLSIQIISYTWKIDGKADVVMPYDPGELYQFPGRGLIE
jgi:putative Flp pilus-assembly TadE/G-like protein